jgi:hypothetical protein
MFQEIFTYMIIGAAIALAISKVINIAGRKKSPEKEMDFQNDTIQLQHYCPDCSAECMLRDAAKPMIEKNKELCKKIEMGQKS